METNSIDMLADIMAMSGFPHSAGMRVLAAEPGKVSLALAKKPELTQFFGHFHGGVITGLADQAAGAAVSTALPKGRIAVTVEIKINFLGPADGEEIVANAEAIQVGGSIAVAKVEVVSEAKGQRRVCGFGVATMRAVDMPARP
ncbi:PaaI family thioesterase [Bradyrhizobium manausense]|uniref:PaaI family thioesterase n=1 Tax=Bradyrhizobium TaxID=374 RepID=UPI001BA4D91D|nr:MULTISPECIES: PaaI family thioesterase [Bradyrhizobium]MBR0830582.1 PaaI family thioesterase [Bradyrhizobium manausense]UVO28192.1 PaaI family thioesterase [Bradyrhizobium arachidis]